MDFKISQFKNSLLAPGDISWHKKSGEDVLISRKAEMMNIQLIKKLEAAREKVLLENPIDLDLQRRFEAMFEKYNSELLIKDKLVWREKIIHALRVDFIEKHRSQLDFDFMTWNIFSKIPLENGQKYIERDEKLFKRNLTITATYTWVAFLIGYYDTTFLSNLFSHAMTDSMNMGLEENVMTLKDKLEYLRMIDYFDEKDFSEINELIPAESYKRLVLFERANGSGPLKLNIHELSDLELIIWSMHKEISFKDDFEINSNTLSMIMSGQLKIDDTIEQIVTRSLTRIDPNNKGMRAG